MVLKVIAINYLFSSFDPCMESIHFFILVLLNIC